MLLLYSPSKQNQVLILCIQLISISTYHQVFHGVAHQLPPEHPKTNLTNDHCSGLKLNHKTGLQYHLMYPDYSPNTLKTMKNWF